MKKKFAILFLCFCLAFSAIGSGCTTMQRATIKATAAKVVKITGPMLLDAQKALSLVQKNYAFWSALVQGTLKVAGITITQAQIDAARPVIAAADAVLVPLGAAVKNTPVDPAAVQNAIIAVNNAVPALAQKALANPAVNALYQAYLAGKTNVPAAAL